MMRTIDDEALLLQQVAPNVLARVRADGSQQQRRHLPAEREIRTSGLRGWRVQCTIAHQQNRHARVLTSM